MGLQDSFAAGGCLLGRRHREAGAGAQDSWAVVRRGAVVAAAVADGCSAGERSAVGAGLAARVAAAAAARLALSGVSHDELPGRVVAELVELLRNTADAGSLDTRDRDLFVQDALLATIQVAVADDGRCVVFGIGDGVVFADDRLIVLDDDDTPDYPAYALFPRLPAPRLRVHHTGALGVGVVLCSDGARELLADGAPASRGPLANLPALLADPRLARNPSLLQKRLRAWGAEHGAPVDDCTLVVIAPMSADASPTERAPGATPWA